MEEASQATSLPSLGSSQVEELLSHGPHLVEVHRMDTSGSTGAIGKRPRTPSSSPHEREKSRSRGHRSVHSRLAPRISSPIRSGAKGKPNLSRPLKSKFVSHIPKPS